MVENTKPLVLMMERFHHSRLKHVSLHLQLLYNHSVATPRSLPCLQAERGEHQMQLTRWQ